MMTGHISLLYPTYIVIVFTYLRLCLVVLLTYPLTLSSHHIVLSVACLYPVIIFASHHNVVLSLSSCRYRLSTIMYQVQDRFAVQVPELPETIDTASYM